MSVLDASKPNLRAPLVLFRYHLSRPFSRLARGRQEKLAIARLMPDRTAPPFASVPAMAPMGPKPRPPRLTAGNIAAVDHLESRRRLARGLYLMVVQWSLGFVLLLAACVIILAFAI